MKLRNKKTGEIGYLELEKADDKNNIALRVYKNDFIYKRYESLTEVIAEWEDYEENRVQIKLEKRPLEERLLNLEIKMADAEDDITMLKEEIAKLCEDR